MPPLDGCVAFSTGMCSANDDRPLYITTVPRIAPSLGRVARIMPQFGAPPKAILYISISPCREFVLM